MSFTNKTKTKTKLIAECEKLKEKFFTTNDEQERGFLLGFLQGTLIYCAYLDKAYFKGLQAFIIENSKKGDNSE